MINSEWNFKKLFMLMLIGDFMGGTILAVYFAIMGYLIFNKK